MALNFGRILTLSTGALAFVIATTSIGIAGPAALVESISSAQVMLYVDTGKTFRLGPEDTMVLSYLDVCIRETITGGTVTIGIDHSEVQGGKIARTKLDCPSHLFTLSSANSDIAGRALRGVPSTVAFSPPSLINGPTSRPHGLTPPLLPVILVRSRNGATR